MIRPKGVDRASFGGALLGGGARGKGGGHTRGGWRLLREGASWKGRVQVQRSVRRQPRYTQGGGNRSILRSRPRRRVRVLTPCHIRGHFGRARVLILLRICSDHGLFTRDRRNGQGNPPKNAPNKRARGREPKGLGSPVPASWEGETAAESHRVVDRREALRRPWARRGPQADPCVFEASVGFQKIGLRGGHMSGTYATGKVSHLTTLGGAPAGSITALGEGAFKANEVILPRLAGSIRDLPRLVGHNATA